MQCVKTTQSYYLTAVYISNLTQVSCAKIKVLVEQLFLWEPVKENQLSLFFHSFFLSMCFVLFSFFFSFFSSGLWGASHHLPRQQQLVLSHTTLTCSLPSSSSTFKERCLYFGPPCIIRDEVHILRSAN